MASIPLNKFEKKKRVIDLHMVGKKMLKEIATEVHMSFRDISKIIKPYDKKRSLEQNKKERQKANNQTPTKKESLKTLFILKNSFCIL